MKRYYTKPSEDPASDQFDPAPRKTRPQYSENAELNALRIENTKLRNRVSELEHDAKPKKEAVVEERPVEVTVQEIGQSDKGTITSSQRKLDEGLSPLTFTHVDATPKAPSGGIISTPASPKAKAAPKPKKTGGKKKS